MVPSYMGTVRPREGSGLVSRREGEGVCIFGVEGEGILAKYAQNGWCEFAFYDFSVAILQGRESDVRLNEGSRFPLKALLPSCPRVPS